MPHEHLATHLDPEFLPLLGPYDLDTLNRSPGVVFGMWPDSRLAYLSPAYERFARENGAPDDFMETWGLGAKVLDAVPAELRDFFVGLFAGTLRRGQAWEHEYECPSPELARRFLLRLHPLGAGEGLLAVNAVVMEKPRRGAGKPPLEPLYRESRGLVVQCSHCRLVRRAEDPARWDFVPAFIERPPQAVSHDVCPTCLGMYFRNPL